MKFKVTAKYYVDAPNWIEAEQQVEQRLINADQIDSEPTSRAAKDVVSFGLSTKIYNEHNKIFFEDELDKTYDQKIESLRHKTLIWLESLLDETIKTNEQEWV